MTYSINVRPYNDPYIKMAEEAMEAAAELLIAGAFLVDIIPVLKYVPEWFPGAEFQSKAAMMRKHAAMIRNTMIAETEKLMVCDPLPFLGFLLNYLTIRSQASGDYDPSLVTEGLREIEYSDTSNKDTELLKDVAVAAYMGYFDILFCLYFLLTEKYLRWSGYHGFSTWNILLGDGLLSRSSEGGSSRT